jgi:uncharacterized protein YqhQ
MGRPFSYGGQAVIEGVMMRGSRMMAVAVRDPEGKIRVQSRPLNAKLYTGAVSRIPFLRGLIILWDTIGLGTKALLMSADIAVGEEASLEGPAAWGTILGGVGLGVGLFMLLPSFLAGLVAQYLGYEWVTALFEGLVRLMLIVGYVWVVGRLKDIRRVFSYHGAEHKTIHAYEAGVPLTPGDVQAFSTAHARCGTAFLLTLVVVTVLVFAPLGRQTLLQRLASRILLLPLVAGVSYEIIRVLARFADKPWARWLMKPNLALQRLTTREPTDEMVEVAIEALNSVLVSEGAAVAETTE